MERIQVSFSEEAVKRMKANGNRLGLSLAAFIRMCCGEWLREKGESMNLLSADRPQGKVPPARGK